MIEFDVDSAKKENGRLIVRGAVNSGDISVGCKFISVFKWANETLNLKQRTLLIVEGIVAYDRSFDILPQGWTGELHLTGEIDTPLQEKDVLGNE